MDMQPDITRHAPGLGGALFAALLKLREGWRIFLVQFAMGGIPIMVLRGTIDWAAKKFDAPAELLGFAVGFLAVAVATKAIETVQALEIAKPFNGLIERWTGAKAPPKEPQP